MKRKLAAAAAAIVLLLGVGYAGYAWYRHATREDPFASLAPDAPEAPKWTASPPPPENDNGTPEQDPPENDNGTPEQDPPEDAPWPARFVPPGDWSPKSASLMPLDVTVELPEVPPEITGPSPPIEDEPGECR